MAFAVRGRSNRKLSRKEVLEKADDGGIVKIDYMAKREAGVLNFEFLSLKQIIMDPDNPRTRGIDPAPLVERIPDFLVIDPNDELYNPDKIAAFDAAMDVAVEEVIARAPEDNREYLSEFFKRLIPLRDNIRLLRVKQPIEVRAFKNKRASKYQIIYGHRRFLASLLAGESNIPARVVVAEANDKRVQASENIMQESLTLAQRLDMFRQLFDSLSQGKSLSVRQLSAQTGYRKSLVHSFKLLIDKASTDLVAAINDGDVTSLSKAVDIAKLPAKEQTMAVDAIRSGRETPLQIAPQKKKTKSKSKKGPAKSTIRTPVFRNAEDVRYLLHRLGADEADSNDIDWSDLADVEELWHKVIERLLGEAKRG